MNRFKLTVFVALMLNAILLFTLGAAVGITWTKSEITPVIIVKPGIGGFVPMEGSPIGNIWSKSDVKPVLLLKPSIGGFVAREGIGLDNTWKKKDVIPVMLVATSQGGFVPLPFDTQQSPNKNNNQSTTTTQSVIESQISGEFEEWDGETIVKLTNGQIWQQTEYYYYYHYAYMPKVLIYQSAGGYKMKIDGIEHAVGVKQLK